MYLVKVDISGCDYRFFLKNSDGEYSYYFFTLHKYSCRLSCRLQHYKEFKKLVFRECTICNSHSKCGRHLRGYMTEN